MEQINVKGSFINITGIGDDDYVSITDIARFKTDGSTRDVIVAWLRKVDTIEFLTLWEQINNPDFKPVDFDLFKSKPGSHAFTLSRQKWTELSNPIGIKVKSGRYGGGTVAQRDMALGCAGGMAAEVKLYGMKEVQRRRSQEGEQVDWNGRG